MQKYVTPSTLSKTNYILYRECPKNVWLKVHKPEVYFQFELSEFEKGIIETGNEVESVARKLFPTGVLVESRDEEGVRQTQKLLDEKSPTIFQAVFEKDGYYAAVDILKLNEDGTYSVYEVKATNGVDQKTHFFDLGFQTILLEKCGLKISGSYIIHLNSEYIRDGELEITKLFTFADLTEKIQNEKSLIEAEMEKALAYIKSDVEPSGPCSCIYKGRSSHCTTFAYSNPSLPSYGIHDLTRIGISKKKLMELVDGNNFTLDQVPGSMELSDAQRNQIDTYIHDRVIHISDRIKEEFETLVFPLYFLDYETYPCAIPRYDKFSTYQQVPFQYSLHVLDSPDAELKHYEFIYTEDQDPSLEFVNSLQSHIGNKGSVIVWHKGFECSRNRELAQRIPQSKAFFDDLDSRVFDLEDIFKKQYYVHKDFKGSSSIKKVLPVLVPELSYKDLNVQDGGAASNLWNEIVCGNMNEDDKKQTTADLLKYCELDTYAMYAIWKKIWSLVNLTI